MNTSMKPLDNTLTLEDVCFPVHEERVRAVSELSLDNVKMTVNSRTGQPLGVVGKDYKIVTNEELFGSMLNVIDKMGLEKKVSFQDKGARTFMHVELPSISFERDANVGDITSCTLTAQNSFDGSLRAGINLGAMRLVCSNGMSSGESLANVIRKHTARIDTLAMVGAVEASLKQFDVLAQFWEAMAEIELKDTARRAIINKFAPSNKMKKAQKRLKATAIFPEKYRATVKEVYKKPHAYGDQRDNSLYSIYNAFTETATHHIGLEVAPARLAEYNHAIFKGFNALVKA